MSAASDFNPVIRVLFPQTRVDQRFFAQSPVLANMERSKDFAERTKYIAVQRGIPQGGSHTAATALDSTVKGVTGSKFESFAVTIAEDFQAGTIDDLTMERGKVNKAALVDALEKEIGGMIDNLAARASFEIHRSGTNARGRVGTSGISTTSLTLATRTDVYNFEVGMQICLSDTETGALRDTADYITIIAINPATGVLTGDAAWTNISGATDADYLFARGDAPNNTGSILGLVGLGGWNPYATPGALFGVTRTTHAERLAGIRYSGASDTTVKKAIRRLATQIFLASRGAAANKSHNNVKVILHPDDLDSLIIDLQSAVRYVDKSSSKIDGVFFSGCVITTQLGDLECLPDPYAPAGYARIVNFDHFMLDGLGEVPHIVQNDGLKTLRASASFGQEFRAVWRAQAVCDMPVTMGVALLP